VEKKMKNGTTALATQRLLKISTGVALAWHFGISSRDLALRLAHLPQGIEKRMSPSPRNLHLKFGQTTVRKGFAWITAGNTPSRQTPTSRTPAVDHRGSTLRGWGT